VSVSPWASHVARKMSSYLQTPILLVSVLAEDESLLFLIAPLLGLFVSCETSCLLRSQVRSGLEYGRASCTGHEEGGRRTDDTREPFVHLVVMVE
jgi:hypothetical protein